MTPRRLLATSSLLLSALFVWLLVVQGRQLGASQLHGMVFAALMSAVLNVLVFRARSFAEAARWYIAVLAVAVVGSVAAAVVRAPLGDVVGLLGAVTAALVCAAKCVSTLRTSAHEDDAIISERSIAALDLLTQRIKRDVTETLAALGEATEMSEPFLLERLGQLRAEAAHVEAWSRRMRLPDTHPVRRSVSNLRRRLLA